LIGILAIIVGILVLAFPDLIRWFIGIGLIAMGALLVGTVTSKTT